MTLRRCDRVAVTGESLAVRRGFGMRAREASDRTARERIPQMPRDRLLAACRSTLVQKEGGAAGRSRP